MHTVTSTAEWSLDTVPSHLEASIIEMLEPGELGVQLLEMGLVPGTPVKVIRRGFRRDPVQLQIRGYMLTLRRAQSQHIRVRIVEAC